MFHGLRLQSTESRTRSKMGQKKIDNQRKWGTKESSEKIVYARNRFPATVLANEPPETRLLAFSSSSHLSVVLVAIQSKRPGRIYTRSKFCFPLIQFLNKSCYFCSAGEIEVRGHSQYLEGETRKLTDISRKDARTK